MSLDVKALRDNKGHRFDNDEITVHCYTEMFKKTVCNDTCCSRVLQVLNMLLLSCKTSKNDRGMEDKTASFTHLYTVYDKYREW